MKTPTQFRATLTFPILVTLLAVMSSAHGQGNAQIAGTGFGDSPSGDCTASAPAGFEDFTIVLMGDLVGCLYTQIDLDSARVSPSNVYEERGREIITACVDVSGNGECEWEEPYGTFETTYHFTSKWAGAPFESDQIFGRCQHPVVKNSGTGDFEGVSGRLDFRDNVETGTFDWRGHLKVVESL